VAIWIETQPLGLLNTTSITVAEILHGIRLLPVGKRRRSLEDQFRDFLSRGFRDRVLGFDASAADAYSAFFVARQRRGRPVDRFDAMIAGVAISRGADIATRNVGDFRGCGARLINPWTADSEGGA
jgi:predicted nucleic acid-binding protein